MNGVLKLGLSVCAARVRRSGASADQGARRGPRPGRCAGFGARASEPRVLIHRPCIHNYSPTPLWRIRSSRTRVCAGNLWLSSLPASSVDLECQRLTLNSIGWFGIGVGPH
jgi:hypothetical protein